MEVDHPQTVGADQQQIVAPHQRQQLFLQRTAQAVGAFAKAIGIDDQRLDARLGALLNHLEHAFAVDDQNGEVGHDRRTVQVGMAGLAPYLLARRIDEIHRTGILHALQGIGGLFAVMVALGCADNGDCARRQQEIKTCCHGYSLPLELKPLCILSMAA